MQLQGSSCQHEHANLNMQRTGGFQSETEREAILRAAICVRVARCGQSREIPYVTWSPAGYSTLVAVCCCYLFTKGPRNEKIEPGLQCQGRRGDNLASLGPSNEQTSCHSACVCVYHLQDGMCTSAESLWSVGRWAVVGPCGAVAETVPWACSDRSGLLTSQTHLYMNWHHG